MAEVGLPSARRPLVFLLITGWTLFYTVQQRPLEAWLCLGVIVSGALFYRLSVALGNRREANPS